MKVPCAGGLFALLLAVLLTACESRESPVQAADRAFTLLREGKTKEFFQNSSFGFQARRSPAEFERAINELGLPGLKSAQWTQTSADKKQAALVGEIVNAAGQPVRLALELVRDQRRWKVYSLRVAPAGTSSAGKSVGLSAHRAEIKNLNPPPVPAPDEIQQLIRDALAKFDEGLQAKNFTALYEHVSETWRSQITPQRLNNAFEPFITAGVRIEGVRNVVPTLVEPPRLDSEGLLHVRGYCPSAPAQLHFALKFIYELPKWKLFGINAGLEKNSGAGGSPAPTPG